jgi:hypothetical protein
MSVDLAIDGVNDSTRDDLSSLGGLVYARYIGMRLGMIHQYRWKFIYLHCIIVFVWLEAGKTPHLFPKIDLLIYGYN